MRLLLLIFLMALVPALAQRDHDQHCQTVASVPLLPESLGPRPTVFPACESYMAYAGIGRPVDYAAARMCAWKERAAQLAELPQNAEAPTAWAIGGDLILVNLYANGFGVPRSLPLALHLACEDRSGIAGDAVDNVYQLFKETVPPTKPFDVCDSAFSTFSMNFCSDYQSEIADERRNRAIRAFSTQWTPAQKSAFAKVKDAEEKYVSAHSQELDQGGTIHILRGLGSAGIMHQNFYLDLRQFERGQIPKGTSADAITVESRMNLQYRANLAAARAPLPSLAGDTAVTVEGIEKVQETWRQYRDAWLAFATVRYPSVPSSAFRVYFAEERRRLLLAMRSQIYRD
jgi:hypothetical protein